MTTAAPGHSRIGDLVHLLVQMRDLYGDMQEILEAKLEAMKRADSDRLNDLAARERRLVERIRERDGLRRQLVALVCQEVGIGAGSERAVTLTELASRIQEPRRGHLLSLSQSLRDVVMKVGETNRIIGTVSDVMLKHFGKVYEAMTSCPEDPGVYSAKGVSSRNGGRILFSTVG